MCAIDNLEILYIIFITLIYFGVVVVLKIFYGFGFCLQFILDIWYYNILINN